MKPEWCPQDVWDAAIQLCEDLAFHYDAECIEMTARALLEAHQRGRREGMEMAAEMSDAWKRPSAIKLAAGEMTAQELRTAIAVAGGISSAIRAKLEEVQK